MNSINYPLSNMQLELLKLFSRDLEEKDLIEIKRLIVNYLAKRLSDKADEIWNQREWTDEKMDEFLETHMREEPANFLMQEKKMQ